MMPVLVRLALVLAASSAAPATARDEPPTAIVSTACEHGIRMGGIALGHRGAECMGTFRATQMTNEGRPVWQLDPATLRPEERQIEFSVEGLPWARPLFLFYLRTLEWRGWACGWKVGFLVLLLARD